MGGIRIGRGAAVHTEALDDLESVTLCGKGADMITGTSEDVSCKLCLKALAKIEAAKIADAEVLTDAEAYDAMTFEQRVAAGAGMEACGACGVNLFFHPELEQYMTGDERVICVKAAGGLHDPDEELFEITDHGFSGHSRRPMECRMCGLAAGQHATTMQEGSSAAMWLQAHPGMELSLFVPEPPAGTVSGAPDIAGMVELYIPASEVKIGDVVDSGERWIVTRIDVADEISLYSGETGYGRWEYGEMIYVYRAPKVQPMPLRTRGKRKGSKSMRCRSLSRVGR